MKLVTTARHLRAALKLLAPVIEKRATFPALSCVLFDGRKIVGTNLDMIMQADLVASEAKGRAVIDYFALSALVKYLPGGDELTIMAGAERAIVKFGWAEYDLPLIEVAAFPEISGWKGRTADAIGALNLKVPLADVLPFISSEWTRYYLNGFCFSRDRERRPVLVSTDGHRLVASPFECDAPWLDGRIVPEQAARLIGRMPEQARVESVRGHDGILRFVWPGVVLVTKLIEGKFPDWHRVTPVVSPKDYAITLETAPLWAGLRRLSAMNGRDGRAVTIAFDALDAILRAGRDETGIGVERIGHVRRWPDGPPYAVSYNAHYLVDMLKLFSAYDKITLTFKDNSSPAIISVEGSEVLAVLMPMRGSDDVAALAALEGSAAKTMAAAE